MGRIELCGSFLLIACHLLPPFVVPAITIKRMVGDDVTFRKQKPVLATDTLTADESPRGVVVDVVNDVQVAIRQLHPT